MADPATQSTSIFDIEDPITASFMRRAVGEGNPLEQLERLYYVVRDQIHYEIFGVGVSAADVRASAVITAMRGFCLHKSVLFVTGARSLGFPSRLASTTVTNHLSSDAIRRLVGGDEFVHWFAEVAIEGRWVKFAPVFNRLLCRIYGIEPMDFDLSSGALSHSAPRGRTMVATADVRYFDGCDAEDILNHIARHHPLMINGSGRIPEEIKFRTPTLAATKGHIHAR